MSILVSHFPRTLLVLTLVISACSGGETVTPTPPPPPPPPAPVASVSVTLASPGLTVGLTTQATAVLSSAAGTTLSGRAVAWSSSATNVASVSAAGLVTAVGEGVASITATSEGRSGSAQVTVSPPPVATVTVTLAASSLTVGLTTQASADLRDGSGAPLTGRPVAWSSSATNIATVSAAGLVSAVGAGVATITATSEGKSGSAQLTVGLAPVATVTVTLPAPTLAVGMTAQAGVQLKDAAGAPLTGRTVTWSSSQASIATISTTTGLITAVAPGTTTITATSEGQSGTAALTVVQAPVATITFPADSIDVPFRASAQLVPTLKDAGGNVLTGRTVTYQTSNATLVSVTAGGMVRSLLPGTVTITATSEGQSATVRVRGSLANLSAIVDSIRQAHGMPAMGAAIVHREGLIGLGAGGLRRATGGAQVTVEDKWHIGSNTKALTAVLAGMAVEAGVLTWQRTIQQAFPDLSGTTLPAHLTLTLSELLSHTGGLITTQQGLIDGPLPAARLSWAKYVLSQPLQNPRGIYSYNNPGFGIAGSMIERAWSSTYEDLMATKLYQPLGVTGAGWGPTAGVGGEQPVSHYLSGNTWIPAEAFDNHPGMSSAGTGHMPLRGWARIIQELLLADQGRSTLLTQTTARYLTTNAVPPGGGGSYGMGWVIPSGGRYATHDGSNTRNHSRAWMYLDTGVAYLMTTNAADLAGGRSGAALGALQQRLQTYFQSGQ
ncbi:MAG: serine hydrolase [Gemmatimonadales bacterium]